MRFLTNTKILTYIIVLLIVSNISTIITIYYHKKEFHPTEKVDNIDSTKKLENRGYVFREKLDLTDDQQEAFIGFLRNYNRNARQISLQLQDEREQLILELGKADSDSLTLDNIAVNIGNLHAELKRLTSEYYSNMESECNEEQAQKLKEIFLQLLNSEGNVNLPKPGGRWRGGNNN